MMKRTASEVFFDEKLSRPVLVNFENGEVHTDKLKDFACSLYKDENNLFVPVLGTDKMIYSNTINRNNQDELYYNVLAIKNKTTKKIRYVVLDSVNLKATPVVKKDFELNSTITQDATTMSELNKTFGSKRTQRQTEQFERMKVNVNNMKEDLEKTVANIETDLTEMEESTAPKLDLYLPPKNESAAIREDVYKIKEIIPKKILKSLNEIAETIINDESNSEISTDYVKKELNAIRESGSAKLETVRILLVLDCLIAMTMATIKAIVLRAYKPCPYSEMLSDYLFETFTTTNEGKRFRSASMKQKAISYILVFALLSNNYEVDLEAMGQTMKMSVKKLQDTCRALLLTPSKQKKKTYELLLPLPKAPELHSGNKATKRFK